MLRLIIALWDWLWRPSDFNGAITIDESRRRDFLIHDRNVAQPRNHSYGE